VAHYLRLAPGKLGVTFDTDVESATDTAAAFRANGVPAEVVSAKTPDHLRAQIIRRFRNREILQLVNVDLFGEGFDLPAIEVVSFARATESFALYSQQKGRCLRLMLASEMLRGYDNLSNEQRRQIIAGSGKPHGIIIDHVGNVLRHGLADAQRDWTQGLNRRDKRSGGKSDAIPMRVCVNPECIQPYERSGPEFVDGDLTELDPATLAALRGEIARIDGDAVMPWGASAEVQGAVRRKHWERQQGQALLRNSIAWWAGLETAQGRGESESYRRFYFKFGLDVANAQTLSGREAAELSERVNEELRKYGIDGNIEAMSYFSQQGV